MWPVHRSTARNPGPGRDPSAAHMIAGDPLRKGARNGGEMGGEMHLKRTPMGGATPLEAGGNTW
jgi:hypothetical protein